MLLITQIFHGNSTLFPPMPGLFHSLLDIPINFIGILVSISSDSHLMSLKDGVKMIRILSFSLTLLIIERRLM
jgi:hypothetical protein